MKLRSSWSPPLGRESEKTLSQSPIFSPLDGRLKQVRWLHAQRYGQRLDVIEREVDEPSLDLTDMRLVEIGELGQTLLAQPLCLAKALDVLSENAARRFRVRPIHSDGRTKAGVEIL